MASGKVRVVGSNYTAFLYQGQPIAFCEGIEDSGQKAFSDLGQPFQFIHPLGSPHPVEIATSRVLQGGTLILTIRELWNAPVWQQLAGLAGTNNIADVFAALSANPAYVSCQTIIKPPGSENNASAWRGKTYLNATVVDIQDGDTITVGALAVTKGITVAYTHTTPLR
jgi:hypothetical protein